MLGGEVPVFGEDVETPMADGGVLLGWAVIEGGPWFMDVWGAASPTS